MGAVEDPGTGFACPLPLDDHPTVLLAHGGGGSLMHRLLEELVLPAFRNPWLDARHDGALLDLPPGRVAFTTDSYVVRPLFFPGGDIGSLAVNGTVNDLSMCGARPRFLSAGLIIEEGFPIEDLGRVLLAMRAAADAAGVTLVTGDTKVVDRGKGDGLFVNTAGIGVVAPGVDVGPARLAVGDAVILSGDLGRHGIAIMASREGLEFECPVESDCAPLWEPVKALLEGGVTVHALRDLTRGGLASALVELAEAAGLSIHVEEGRIPVPEEVLGACEILGLDPHYVANEGRFVAFVPEDEAETALSLLRGRPVSAGARRIGEVDAEEPGLVTLTATMGTRRVMDRLSGEQLPRIC